MTKSDLWDLAYMGGRSALTWDRSAVTWVTAATAKPLALDWA